MKRFLILFLLLVSAGATVFAQADLQPVALVRLTKTEPITVKQLKAEIEALTWQEMVMALRRVPTAAEVSAAAQKLTPEKRRQVLDLMINQKLALQAAERDRITVTENDLNQHINQMKAQLSQQAGRQPTDTEFAQVIKNETGQDINTFKDTLRQQAIVQKYMESKKGTLYKNVQQPTEAEILNYYNLTRTQYVRPNMVRVSIIQVSYTDAASRTKAKETADRLVREIGADGSKFNVAAVRGRTPNSGYQAGDPGYYIPRTPDAQQLFGEEWMNVVFGQKEGEGLKEGEVSRLINGVNSYQIVKVTENHPQQSLELDDILDLGTSRTVRQLIAERLFMERQQQALARATQELAAELRTGNPFQIMEAQLNNW